MKILESRSFWGLVLILGGGLFLLQNLGYLPGGNLFVAGLMGLAGALFLSVYLSNRVNWWALIPGTILCSLALVTLLNILFPENSWSGSLFLAGIGASFWLVYATDRRNWWAIIPGGVMVTLAVVALVEDVAQPTFDTGGIFFIGLGATFLLVALLPTAYGQMRWAFIPAAALLIMGALLLAANQPLINYIWPAALIALGGYFLYRALRPGKS